MFVVLALQGHGKQKKKKKIASHTANLTIMRPRAWNLNGNSDAYIEPLQYISRGVGDWYSWRLRGREVTVRDVAVL